MFSHFVKTQTKKKMFPIKYLNEIYMKLEFQWHQRCHFILVWILDALQHLFSCSRKCQKSFFGLFFIVSWAFEFIFNYIHVIRIYIVELVSTQLCLLHITEGVEPP